MSEACTFQTELTRDEFYSLRECLSYVRKDIDQEYQRGGMHARREPMQDALFVAASKLAYKLAKVENPATSVTLQDFLNYGNYGLNS